jgi:hypothetical protein
VGSKSLQDRTGGIAGALFGSDVHLGSEWDAIEWSQNLTCRSSLITLICGRTRMFGKGLHHCTDFPPQVLENIEVSIDQLPRTASTLSEPSGHLTDGGMARRQ